MGIILTIEQALNLKHGDIQLRIIQTDNRKGNNNGYLETNQSIG